MSDTVAMRDSRHAFFLVYLLLKGRLIGISHCFSAVLNYALNHASKSGAFNRRESPDSIANRRLL